MMTPEEVARERIDDLLALAGWTVQDRDEVSLGASAGVAVREFPLRTGYGEADYLLFDRCQDIANTCTCQDIADGSQPDLWMESAARWGETMDFDPVGCVQFFPFGVAWVGFGIAAYLLAREKGRNVPLWTVLGLLPVINFISMAFFIGAKDLNLDRKLDELLKATKPPEA